MRHPLLPEGLPEISYGIRQIVSKGFERKTLGYPVIWENIGDPVQKGVHLPAWMKDVIAEKIQLNDTFGYCDSKGLLETRKYVTERTNRHGGYQITPDDVTFFNGLGDAIARFYGLLSNDVQVLMPSPTYPAHTGAEKLHIGSEPLTYPLHPENGWLPDPAEVRELVKANPAVCSLLIINPDNPTGMVYTREQLSELVQIAREYDLFIVADEIYENLVYEGEMVRLAEVIGDVPALVMKGISKEVPWPGSRCGWVEYYNRDSDADFRKLCERMDQCKMTEVCSTTLPQAVLPDILSHAEHGAFLEERKRSLAEKMDQLRTRLSRLDGVECNGARGAFYATIHTTTPFSTADIDTDHLPDALQQLYNRWTTPLSKDEADLHLVYYLLAAEGICTVPLSGFNSTIPGIRITLLEQDPEQFSHMLDRLVNGLHAIFNRKSSMVQAG